MCVEMNHREIRVLSDRRAYGSQRDQMLAAQQERALSIVQDLGTSALDIAQGHCRIAKAQFQIAAVKNSPVRQILV